MITFGGFILTDAGGFWLQQPVPSPSPIGEGAIRFRFENTSLDPVAAELSIYGTWTQVIDITSGRPIPGLWDYYPNLRKANFTESMREGSLTVESCNGMVDIVDIKLSSGASTTFFQDAFVDDTAINKVNIESLTARVSCVHMFQRSGVTEANVLMDGMTTTEDMFASCPGLRKAYIRTVNGIGNNCFEESGGIEDLTIEITGDGYFIFQGGIEEIGGGAKLRNVTFIAAEGSSYRLYRNTSDSINAFREAELLESVTVYERGTSGQLTQVPLPLTGNAEYAFRNCRSLTYMPLMDVSNVNKCTKMFEGCVNIAGGILDVYDVLKIRCASYGLHIQAFSGCGINSTTGRAELMQIPNDWK